MIVDSFILRWWGFLFIW